MTRYFISSVLAAFLSGTVLAETVQPGVLNEKPVDNAGAGTITGEGFVAPSQDGQIAPYEKPLNYEKPLENVRAGTIPEGFAVPSEDVPQTHPFFAAKSEDQLARELMFAMDNEDWSKVSKLLDEGADVDRTVDMGSPHHTQSVAMAKLGYSKNTPENIIRKFLQKSRNPYIRSDYGIGRNALEAARDTHNSNFLRVFASVEHIKIEPEKPAGVAVPGPAR